MPLRHCLVLCSLLLVLKAGAEVPSVEPLLRPFVERGELAGAVALTVN